MMDDITTVENFEEEEMKSVQPVALPPQKRHRRPRPVTVFLRPQSDEDKRIRFKYLRRLTREGIWLAPTKQPKSS
jgi:hypothetical protein